MFSLLIDAESVVPAAIERVEELLVAPRVVPNVNELPRDEQRELVRAEMKRKAEARRRRQANRGG